MSFCTITPTRNDRPELLSFCKHQLSRMNTKSDKSYFIDYEPIGNQVDIVPRIKRGIELAKSDGFDLMFIVEDDDHYSKDYFDNIPDGDFIGSDRTTYYNLKHHTYQEWHHPRRSSLFTTGFKISALEGFEWPAENERFLDLALWDYGSREKRKNIVWRESKAIGIKHGIGLLGGRAHMNINKYHDHDWAWLKENVDAEAYAFYKSLKV